MMVKKIKSQCYVSEINVMFPKSSDCASKKIRQLLDKTVEVINDNNIIINFGILKFFFDFDVQSVVKNYNEPITWERV